MSHDDTWLPWQYNCVILFLIFFSQKYLLQDYHFESTAGKPALRFLLKKNPHTQWGEMKLFLQCQVNKRHIFFIIIIFFFGRGKGVGNDCTLNAC